ncbi:MAG TPA: dicarboxylate/amino acid:cation symporter [Pseudomonadota bacterium]|jgi:proton glutamate symport protein|nr:dicarboxylate/amino acid:cation symporter [Pseudomonadota bacterium]
MKKPGLTFYILLGLFLGALCGYLWPAQAVKLQPVAKMFIRLIKMLVAPIILSTLVVGLAGAGEKHIGRLLLKALAWFWAATAVALVIGLGTANLLKPGLGAIERAGATFDAPPPPKPFYEQVIPESIVAALSTNSILQIVFFSVLFAMALSAVGKKGQPVVEALRGVAEAMFKVTEYVMRLAPIGVFAAMAAAIGAQGLGVMLQLAKLVGSLYLALAVFVAVLLVAMKLITGLHIRIVLAALKESLLLAFSTTSSESALPKAMTAMERLGVPGHIVGFVLPAGYSFNLDGSTLYLALASMFIAQATGKYLSPGTQLEMMLTLLVASKGVAAVPRASLVVLATTCATFGLKVEWIATILGVDAVMDMARTTVNVLGNCMASVVVAKWEGQLPADAPLMTGISPPPTANP